MEPPADQPPGDEPVDQPADSIDDQFDDDDDELRRPESRRRDPAHGVAASGVAAAFALGLRQVFDPRPVDTVGIEQEAPTKPVDPDKVELRFDPGSSSGTVVVVRRPDDT